MHDSGLSFRHERYPAYKATREKLTEELQSDFDRGMERIRAVLDAYRIPIISLAGYEADDVIGTLARQGVESGHSVVVVSGDKDFQQLVRPGVWLLNPGRGGPASVEEHWVSVENGAERLGVPPSLVTDYPRARRRQSDNVPGVKGIGEKTAQELVTSYGSVENILAHAAELTKKRPREALLEQGDMALLSKELVTIRDDLPVTLDLDAMRLSPPDYARLRTLYVELEFHTLAKNLPVGDAAATVSSGARRDAPPLATRRLTPFPALEKLVARARRAPYIAIDTETVVDRDAPQTLDPLRARLVGLADRRRRGRGLLPAACPSRIAPKRRAISSSATYCAPRAGSGGRRAPARKARAKKSAAEPTSIAARALAQGAPRVKNLPPLDDPAMRAAARAPRGSDRGKTAQNAKFDLLVLRARRRRRCAGLDFDTMVASYVLDPGRRSHGLDLLALEFLDHKMTIVRGAVRQGQGRDPVRSGSDRLRARLLVRRRRHDLAASRASSSRSSRRSSSRGCFTKSRCRSSRCSPRWSGRGITIDLEWFAVTQGTLRARAKARRAGDLRRRPAKSSTSTPTRSCAKFSSTGSVSRC